MKLIGKVLFVLLILAAIYNFSWQDSTTWVVSILLLLSASLLVLPENSKKIVRTISVVMTALLILNLLIKLLFGS